MEKSGRGVDQIQIGICINQICINTFILMCHELVDLRRRHNKMAASLPFEEAVEKTIEKVIPTLMKIESTRDYSKGSDEHCKYVYLAERLVTGPDRRSIKDQQISQLYTVFRNIYGPQQALALMILLFKVCEDVPSAKELEALVPQSDNSSRRKALLFSGEGVEDSDREKFNVRSLVSRLASELDESQQVNFITLLRGRVNTAEKRSTDFQTILLLMTKAFTSGKITAQDLSKQLLEWLNQLGISEDGDLSVMKEIKEFDLKKPFPGCGHSN